MDIQNMKNMVILKNLPSNMIEEAFVVLKDNVKVHKEELAGNKKIHNTFEKDKNYVIKEAELIVNDYVDKIEKRQFKSPKDRLKLEQKCTKLKYLNIFLGMLSALSIIGFIIK